MHVKPAQCHNCLAPLKVLVNKTPRHGMYWNWSRYLCGFCYCSAIFLFPTADIKFPVPLSLIRMETSNDRQADSVQTVFSPSGQFIWFNGTISGMKVAFEWF